MKEQAPDITGLKITKLPPGQAQGAGDLAKWAYNRAVGRSGVDDAKDVDKLFRCKSCKKETMVCIHRKMRFLAARACRHCGEWNTKVHLYERRHK